MQTFFYFLLRVLAVISVLVTGLLDDLRYALVVIAVMLLYAVVGLVSNRHDRAKIENVADQVYFIGYLSTIAAFAGVVLRIYEAGQLPEEPSPILLMGGVALMTTVLGLVLMTTLKDHAQGMDSGAHATEAEWREKMLEALGELVRAADAGQSPSGSAGSRLLSGVSRKAALSIDELNAEVVKLRNNVERMREYVEQGAESAQVFVQSVEQLQAVLDNFVALLERRLEFESQKVGD